METPGIFPDFKMITVAKKGRLNELDESKEDLKYWLSRPVNERIAAVTFLISQSLAKDESMDKTLIRKRKLRHR